VRFVQVRHPKVGTTVVPETRVPFLADGWALVEDVPEDVDPTDPDLNAPPVKRAPRARKSRKES
jgi:hypothetical protein